ncbi:MAG: hypothetical protein ISR57_08330 [Bacteroidales bacterium]|nr:hypothetical protein [Bacteroidota bacterium]MBL6950633.1 hypothetical protein [Bacteroidales bacterium]
MKKKLMNWYIPVLLINMVFLLYGCSKSETEETYKGVDLNSIHYVNWMSMYADPDFVSMGSLTIPGTHDAAADYDHVPWIDRRLYCTQKYNIKDQMHLGVRYFDLRLGYDISHNPNGLGLYHKNIYLHQNFKDILEDALEFLNTYHTETLIFMVRQNHSSISADEFWAWVEVDLNAANFPADRILDFNPHTQYVQLPTLGQCRKKLWLISLEEAEQFHGLYLNWPDNTKYYSSDYGYISYWVQDHYKLDWVHKSEKFNQVKSLINECRDQSQIDWDFNLYFNFMSGWEIWHGPKGVAEYMNPHVYYWLEGYHKSNPCGIVLMDFAGAELGGVPLLKSLISQNFKISEKK